MFEFDIKKLKKSEHSSFSFLSRSTDITQKIFEKNKDVEFYVLALPNEHIFTISFLGLNMKSHWNDRSFSIYHSVLSGQKIGEIQIHDDNKLIDFNKETGFSNVFKNILDLLDMVRDMGNLGNFSVQGVLDKTDEKFLASDIYDFDFNRYLDFSEALGVFNYYKVDHVQVIETATPFFRRFYSANDLGSFSTPENTKNSIFILRSSSSDEDISLKFYSL